MSKVDAWGVGLCLGAGSTTFISWCLFAFYLAPGFCR